MSAADTPYLHYAMFNEAVLAIEDLKVSPLGSGFMAGEGVFETIRVVDGRPVFFESHQARLASSLRSLSDARFSSRGELHTRCMRVIAANSLASGSLKIVLFKEAAGWSEIILARSPAYTPSQYEKGFRLKFFPGDLRVEPVNGLKSLNYLGNLHAKRMAVAAGYDEALFVDPADRVLEGATSNIFIVKDCVISTPPLDAGILPGVIRGAIVRKLGQGVREREIGKTELLEADEVFVTNALLGVMPVATVDAMSYDLTTNAITRSVITVLATLSG